MGKQTIPLYIVEAFTTGENDAFTGNTAAVCLLDFDDDISDLVKRTIGMNMNLSETSFVSKGWKNGTKFGDPLRWTLRWFTPTIEIPLCGHATLAAANIIFNEILKEKFYGETDTSIVFESKFRGELGATMNWSTGLITINFPANLTVPVTIQENPWISTLIEKTLGDELGPEVIEDIHYAKEMGLVMLRLRDTNQGPTLNEALLKKLKPDFAGQLAVKPQGGFDLNFVLVTIIGAKDEGSPNLFSRFFAPWAGVDEDPVTGSAHTVLALFWVKEFQKVGVNLESLFAVQSSTRGGKLLCTVQGDRVHIAGSTRMVSKGHFIF